MRRKPNQAQGVNDNILTACRRASRGGQRRGMPMARSVCMASMARGMVKSARAKPARLLRARGLSGRFYMATYELVGVLMAATRARPSIEQPANTLEAVAVRREP